MRQLGEIVLPLLDKLGDDDPDLLFEPMAGQGQMLCARAGEVAGYLSAVEHHPRAGLCLDTAHLFAAGHDLTADGGVAAMLGELAAPGGGSDGTVDVAARVKLVHANDSLLACGSRRDRHETIGAGQIGTEPFRALLAALPEVPFVVETPGGKAGHARDIATLKELRGR
jgi:deoxyribonuclease-4